MFRVTNGPYKRFGVNYVINAVVIPNYNSVNLENTALKKEFNNYNQIIYDISNLSKVLDHIKKSVDDSIINKKFKESEALSAQIFDPIRAENLINLKKAFNNIFNELSRPNQWSRNYSMENLVLPMISTGGGGISYTQFFETLFSVIKSRADSNKGLPTHIILSVYPGQKDLYSIKHALSREILQFFASRENKEIANKQRLSFLSRLIGILFGIISFFVLLNFKIIRFNTTDEEIVHSNLLLFSCVMILSALGLTLVLKSYLDNLINWEMLGNYFYLGVVGFISLYVQYLIYKVKDIRRLF